MKEEQKKNDLGQREKKKDKKMKTKWRNSK